MIVCAALLFCVIATGALLLFAAWDAQAIVGLESVIEHEDTMRRLDPRELA